MTVTSRTSYQTRHTAPTLPGSRKRARALDNIPTVEEGKARLAAAVGKPKPWLTPAGLAVFADAPTEDLGPVVYKRPSAE